MLEQVFLHTNFWETKMDLNRWDNLLCWFGVDRKKACEEFKHLTNLYSETGRYYHNGNHIDSCLREFDDVRQFLEYPRHVELAIWYHDAVYDSKSKTNEEDSALLAKAMLGSSFFYHTPEHQEIVERLILATKHAVVPTDIDTMYLVDIDLSILGRSIAEFDEYEVNIRKEYDWVPEKDFIAGRTQVLQSFLNRVNIYSTEFFQNKYEQAARHNLARSIAQLNS